MELRTLAACLALGLIADDEEGRKALREADLWIIFICQNFNTLSTFISRKTVVRI